MGSRCQLRGLGGGVDRQLGQLPPQGSELDLVDGTGLPQLIEVVAVAPVALLGGLGGGLAGLHPFLES